MSPDVSSSPTQTTTQRRLFLCTAVVMAIHALLILGLPRLASAGKPGLGTSAFTTRMVGPTSTEPPQRAAPEPAPSEPIIPQETPVESTPAPQKVTPEAPPAPKPKPKPEAPATESPQTSSETSAKSSRATGGPSGTAGTGSDDEPSLLTMDPPPQFGPFPGVTPIELRPTDEESRDIRPTIKSNGDAPVQIPHAASAMYETTGTVAGIPVVVPTRVTWRHDGSFYESSWIFYHVKAGEQTFYSNGLITPQGLAPLLSTYRTKGDRKLAFDHPGERLIPTPETPDQPPIPMPAGTQDRLSVVFQLASLLAGDPKRYTPGTSISMPVAIPSPPKLMDWTFVVGEEETVTTKMDGKTLKTVRLLHEPSGESDARVELWLSPALEYLPARVRVTEPNGDTMELTVQQAFGIEVERTASTPR